jgi:hypothetical protein
MCQAWLKDHARLRLYDVVSIKPDQDPSHESHKQKPEYFVSLRHYDVLRLV